MSVLTSVYRRGLVYSFACLFNRVVPESLFRFRYHSVYRMNTNDDGIVLDQVECSWCQKEVEIAAAEELTSAIQRNAIGPVQVSQALLEKKLVGAFWSAREEFDETELGVRVELASNQTWLFSANVSKAYRGRKIFGQLLNFTCCSLADGGITDQLVAVNPCNKRSVAVFSKRAKEKPANVMVVRILRIAACLTFGNCKKDNTISWNCRTNPIRIQFPDQ